MIRLLRRRRVMMVKKGMPLLYERRGDEVLTLNSVKRKSKLLLGGQKLLRSLPGSAKSDHSSN